MKTIYNEIPIITDLFTWAGLIIIGISALITLFMFCSKKWTKADASKFVFLWAITGILICIAGMLIKFIYGFNPFSSSIPNVKGLLLSEFGLLLISFGLLNSTQKIDTKSEEIIAKEEKHHE